MRPILWTCVFLVAGCSALSKPAPPNPDGSPQVLPGGEPKTQFDSLLELGGGAAAILGGNPLWATLIGAAGALVRPKVVKPKTK